METHMNHPHISKWKQPEHIAIWAASITAASHTACTPLGINSGREHSRGHHFYCIETSFHVRSSQNYQSFTITITNVEGEGWQNISRIKCPHSVQCPKPNSTSQIFVQNCQQQCRITQWQTPWIQNNMKFIKSRQATSQLQLLLDKPPVLGGIRIFWHQNKFVFQTASRAYRFQLPASSLSLEFLTPLYCQVNQQPVLPLPPCYHKRQKNKNFLHLRRKTFLQQHSWRLIPFQTTSFSAETVISLLT